MGLFVEGVLLELEDDDEEDEDEDAVGVADRSSTLFISASSQALSLWLCSFKPDAARRPPRASNEV